MKSHRDVDTSQDIDEEIDEILDDPQDVDNATDDTEDDEDDIEDDEDNSDLVIDVSSIDINKYFNKFINKSNKLKESHEQVSIQDISDYLRVVSLRVNPLATILSQHDLNRIGNWKYPRLESLENKDDSGE